MAKFKAGDSTALSISGVRYSIPRGTEISINFGNTNNRVVKEAQTNGDGSVTPIYSVVIGKISGIKLRIQDESALQVFNEQQSSDNLPIVLEHVGDTYSCTGVIVANEDGTVEVNMANGTTAEFEIISQSGRIRKL